jgi:hypothetical protein
MDYSTGTFFGRPPFAPFARAASALASERTLPPLRPKATAAGFLRGTADSQSRVAELFTNRVGRHGHGQRSGHVLHGEEQLKAASRALRGEQGAGSRPWRRTSRAFVCAS